MRAMILQGKLRAKCTHGWATKYSKSECQWYVLGIEIKEESRRRILQEYLFIHFCACRLRCIFHYFEIQNFWILLTKNGKRKSYQRMVSVRHVVGVMECNVGLPAVQCLGYTSGFSKTRWLTNLTNRHHHRHDSSQDRPPASRWPRRARRSKNTARWLMERFRSCGCPIRVPLAIADWLVRLACTSHPHSHEKENDRHHRPAL